MSKLSIAVLCGGKSSEHDVSVISGSHVVENLNPDRYQVHLMSVDRQGRWFLKQNFDFPKKVAEVPEDWASRHAIPLVIDFAKSPPLRPLNSAPIAIDVVFPVLHGPYGEDGSVQGLLKLADLAYVGCDILASAANLDKDVTKRLLRQAGVRVCDHMALHAGDALPGYHEVKTQYGETVFIKPANMGSSVGVHRVTGECDFTRAIEDAFQYDSKIVIEPQIQGRELECAILGDRHPKVSGFGEIKPNHDFYSYEAKYINEDGAELLIPAPLGQEQISGLKEVAIRAYQALLCEGLARCDVFLTDDNKIYVNELNTMPGFTPISMYAKLWNQEGVSTSDLLDELIDLARERFNRKRLL